ncbi:hypothetical protein BTVI_93716 [Pitangus sulphuratus]|nr:hypothetical protein BTVI_93716 [Pitangus sulphuratus]
MVLLPSSEKEALEKGRKYQSKREQFSVIAVVGSLIGKKPGERQSQKAGTRDGEATLGKVEELQIENLQEKLRRRPDGLAENTTQRSPRDFDISNELVCGSLQRKFIRSLSVVHTMMFGRRMREPDDPELLRDEMTLYIIEVVKLEYLESPDPPRYKGAEVIRLTEDSNMIRQKRPAGRFTVRDRYSLTQHNSDKIITTEEKKCLNLKSTWGRNVSNMHPETRKKIRKGNMEIT